jgi:hypothetical protein
LVKAERLDVRLRSQFANAFRGELTEGVISSQGIAVADDEDAGLCSVRLE